MVVYYLFTAIIRSMKSNQKLAQLDDSSLKSGGDDATKGGSDGSKGKVFQKHRCEGICTDEAVAFMNMINRLQPHLIMRQLQPNLMAIDELLPLATAAPSIPAAAVAAPVGQVKEDSAPSTANTSAKKIEVEVSQMIEGDSLDFGVKIALATPLNAPSAINPAAATITLPVTTSFPPPPLPPPPPQALPSSSSAKTEPSKSTVLNSGQLLIKREYLPLRRESMLETGCSLFLLDSAHDLVYYRSFQSTWAKTATNSSLSADQGSNKSIGSNNSSEGKAFLAFLIHRLYEYPVLPRLFISQSGTASSHYFTNYFIEESSQNTPIVYQSFLELMKDMILSTD